MIKSMTGYGIDQFHVKETLITVEIRTVNNRYLDIVSKIPRSFMYLENEMKKVIQSSFDRGRVELFLTLSGEHLNEKKLTVDWDLMDQYISKLEKIKTKYSLDEAIPIEMVAQLKDLFIVHETSDNLTTLDETILEGLKRACEQAVANRINDGAYLIADIENHKKTGDQKTLRKIKQLLNELMEHPRTGTGKIDRNEIIKLLETKVL